MASTDSDQLLDGLRVLDLSMHLAGPYGSMLLADMGADVVKVEPPTGDPLRAMEPMHGDTSLIYASINRNKRSLVLDLHTDEGRGLFLDLVEKVDVVYNNFRPGVMDRLGLDFDALVARNPKIIMANLTGYGLDGPRRLAPAYDAAIQALSGGMSITGHPGQAPARAGIPIADLGGGVFLSLSMLAALYRRDRSGEPVMLDISMLDVQVSLMMYWASTAAYLAEDPPPQGSGNIHAYPYGAFPTSDGHVIVAVFSGSFWPKLCAAIDRPDLAADHRLDSNAKRVALRDELEAQLNAVFETRSTTEWVHTLEEHDVPCGPVNTPSQALDDPQVRARDMRVEVDIAGSALAFAGNPIKTLPKIGHRLSAPPLLGEHSRSVLCSTLGLGETVVDDLVKRGIVGESG